MKVHLLVQAVKAFHFLLRRAIFLLLFDSSPRDWMRYWCSRLPFSRHNNIMTTEYVSHAIFGSLLYVKCVTMWINNLKMTVGYAILTARIMDVEFDEPKTLYEIKNSVGKPSGITAPRSPVRSWDQVTACVEFRVFSPCLCEFSLGSLVSSHLLANTY